MMYIVATLFTSDPDLCIGIHSSHSKAQVDARNVVDCPLCEQYVGYIYNDPY